MLSRVAKHPRQFSKRLCLEILEKRTLLSLGLGAAAFSDATSASLTYDWDTVVHDWDGDLFGIRLRSGSAGLSPSYLGTMSTIMQDMAFSPSNDLYGVSGALTDWTSCLYSVVVEPLGDPVPTTFETNFEVAIWTADGARVDLDGLEFDDSGVLWGVGTDMGLWEDYLFTIDLATGIATRQQQLLVDSTYYYTNTVDSGYLPAGDIEFDLNGNLYVTTDSGALLTATRDSELQLVGDTGYNDFAGLTYHPYGIMLGYRSAKAYGDGAHQRKVHQLFFSTDGHAAPTPFGRLYYDDDVARISLDNIYGAATTLRYALADLRVAQFDAPTTLEAGDDFQVSYEIENVRPRSTDGFNLDLYLSRDTQFGDSDDGQPDVKLTTVTIDGLDAQGTTGLLTSPTLTLPAAGDAFWDGAGDGEYFVGIVVDSSDRISESDETNNVDYEAVQIDGTDKGTLSIVINANWIMEDAGAGATSATVSRDGDLSTELIVSLESSHTDEATVPSSCTIPAGQTTSQPFDVDAVDDLIFDGTHTVTITASAVGYDDGQDSVEVIDDDTTQKDYGDAPDPTYPTLAVNKGACHILGSGLYLGGRVDSETDGQPDDTATGDDLHDPLGFITGPGASPAVPILNDEDGVLFNTLFTPGDDATFTVLASGEGKLDAWIDFNGDRSWTEGERIYTAEPLESGATDLTIHVPDDAQPGYTFARFRFSSDGHLDVVGTAPDGEVEDHRIVISAGLPTVTLSIDTETVSEAGGSATVTATLSEVGELPVTIDLGYSGSAQGGGTDYGVSGAQIVIAPGETTGTVAVTAAQDTLDELRETVTVEIIGVTNGTELGDQSVTAQINDDDPPPSVTLDIDNASISENGQVATVTAALSTASGLPVTVQLEFTGTASGSGSDYESSGQQIVIPAGNTSGTVSITAVQDALNEADESVTVDVTIVTNAVELGTQRVVATIIDDDPPPNVTLSIDKNTISENHEVATVTARLDAAAGLPVTVDLGFSGTATKSVDYDISRTQLVFPVGATARTVTIQSLHDTLVEPGETVIVDITGVINGIESGHQQVTTTIVGVPEIGPITGPDTGVRCQEMAYAVQFTSASEGRTHTAKIDWGDGSPLETAFVQQTGAAGVASGSHAYAVAGDHSIKFTITDSNGVSATKRATVDVEVAALFDDPNQPGEKALFVGGTPAYDKLYLSQAANGSVRVYMPGKYNSTFTPSGAGRVYVYAGEGNDYVKCYSSLTRNAVIDGGSGNDRLYGGSGNDTLRGGSGNDRLYGGKGDDLLDGGTGNDSLYGSYGDDVLLGGSGNDRLYGSRDNDSLDGGDGADRLYGSSGNDSLSGGEGKDYLSASSGNDHLDGGSHDDRLYGGSGNDTLFGGSGNDYLSAGSGNDRLHGGDGDDRLYGNSGNDLLSAAAGNDYLSGSSGNDVLLGGLANDSILGGSGRDLLIGGLGSDYLSGYYSDDVLIGGTTSHDANDQALLALLAEWTRKTPIDDRIGNLQNGGGLNGTATLKLGMTVFDDDARDTLYGGSSSDWFLSFDDFVKDKRSRDR